MSDIVRTANAVWEGDSRSGKGQISGPSGVLKDAPYTWATRFENDKGTNPEELIAAAHAACFSMAFASRLAKEGHAPQRLETQATLGMDKTEAGNTITTMRLEVNGQVEGLDEAAFQRLAEEAEKGCPVSRLLRPGLKEVQVVARLV